MTILVPEELAGTAKWFVEGEMNAPQLYCGPFSVNNLRYKIIPSTMYYTDYIYSSYTFESVDFRLEDVFGNSWECDCEYPIREFWTEQIRCEFQDNRSQRRWSLRDTLLTSGDTQIQIGSYSRIEGKKPFFATKILSYTFTSAGKRIGLVEMSGLPGNEALRIHPDINIEKGLAISAAAMAFILKNRRSYYSDYTEGLID